MRLRRPRVVLLAAAALAVVGAGTTLDGFSASDVVGSTPIGVISGISVGPDDLKPPECTMTVTSVLAGSGTLPAAKSHQLVVGSSSADTGTLSSEDCFVGGAGADTVNGVSSGGDECIVDRSASVSSCTVVAYRP